MSDLTKRLLAMQAQLDAVLDVPPTPHFMRRQILNRMGLQAAAEAVEIIQGAERETCGEAMERIESEKPRVQITIDERTDSYGIHEWIGAFFAHPERIQIMRFEVRR